MLIKRYVPFLMTGLIFVQASDFAWAEETEKKQDQFQEELDALYPLSVEEILEARKRNEKIESAIQPKPAHMRTETRQLHVTPGAAPQVVKMTGGYSSTIVFQDMTGAPWPVLSTILGSPAAFSVTQPKTDRVIAVEGEKERTGDNVTGNIINVVPLTQRDSSNLVINLEDCPYPVILHLLTDSSFKGKRSSDALVVFRLDKTGPKAVRPALLSQTGETQELLGFVHGVPPQIAKLVETEPKIPGLRIWKHEGKLYLRTSHALVWPAWTGAAQGEDMHVYVLPETQSAVLSVDGNQVKVVLKGGR